MQIDLRLDVLAGQMIVGGFDGEALPAAFARDLAAGRRAGAILFKRNISSVEGAHAICTSILKVAPSDTPPFVGVDQEGGRVKRLPSPAFELPPMRDLADLGDPNLVEHAAGVVAAELLAIGFNINFAPVLDVHTEPKNPVIGDRAFGSDPDTVARFGVAYLIGLQNGNVLACGKHFPGHGDTHVDSHLGLPVVEHERSRLDEMELPPFRAAIAAGIAALMTAHVVCEKIDPGRPATLSRTICTDLLRAELGFAGVLFSDDLEMKAIAARWPIEEAAVQAVRAGCDALLVCRDQDAQGRVHEALVHEAERHADFRERCTEAVNRSLRARLRFDARPARDSEDLRTRIGGLASRNLSSRLAQAKQRAKKTD
jgi:beta-N-acetylhexosaminidase